MKTFKQYLIELQKVPNFKEIERWLNDDTYADAAHGTDFFRPLVKKYGVKRLGTGAYGTVLRISDYPWAIKVYHSNDVGFEKWVEYCKANKTNPFCPRFKGSPVIIGKSPYKAIRMERLIPITYREYKHFMDNEYKTNKSVIKIREFIASRPKNMLEDIHDENIMQRGSGQIVMVDPLAPK